MIEEQSQQRHDNNTVKMIGRYVKIVPNHGKSITGKFIGEKRLYEYTKGTVFVIETSPGVSVFISRENISYIYLLEAGYIEGSMEASIDGQKWQSVF